MRNLVIFVFWMICTAAQVFGQALGTATQVSSSVVLTFTDARADASYGASVAISGDGNTALMAGGKGDIFVYTRPRQTPSNWVVEGTLPGGDQLSGRGERWTALSRDGNTAVIGWPNYDLPVSGNGGSVNGPLQPKTGAASIWRRTVVQGAPTWSLQTTFTVPNKVANAPGQNASDGKAYVHFGASVAISGDGNTVVVGGPGDDESVGAAWVFNFNANNGTWDTGQKLVGTSSGGSQGVATQGLSVAISDDGRYIVVGAPGYREERNGVLYYPGAAFLWMYLPGAGWVQMGGPLIGTGSQGTNVGQGTAVAIAASDLVIVGGPGDDNNTGAIWFFKISDGQQFGSKITGRNGRVGWGRSISGSPNYEGVVIGSDDGNPVYLPYPEHALEVSPVELIAPNGAAPPPGANLGTGRSVAISRGGKTVIAGFPGLRNNEGGAAVYTLPDRGEAPKKHQPPQVQPSVNTKITLTLPYVGQNNEPSPKSFEKDWSPTNFKSQCPQGLYATGLSMTPSGIPVPSTSRGYLAPDSLYCEGFSNPPKGPTCRGVTVTYPRLLKDSSDTACNVKEGEYVAGLSQSASRWSIDMLCCKDVDQSRTAVDSKTVAIRGSRGDVAPAEDGGVPLRLQCEPERRMVGLQTHWGLERPLVPIARVTGILCSKP
jgi:hypothetical protein